MQLVRAAVAIVLLHAAAAVAVPIPQDPLADPVPEGAGPGERPGERAAEQGSARVIFGCGRHGADAGLDCADGSQLSLKR